MKRPTPVLAAVLLTASILTASEAIAGSAVTADLARPAQAVNQPSARERGGRAARLRAVPGALRGGELGVPQRRPQAMADDGH